MDRIGFGFCKFIVLPVATFVGLSTVTRADQFHYNNFLMGTRAMGLGGAFAGISDDAAGIVYNPAGLAFSLSNDISGSANAFYQSEMVYKDAIGGEDFVESSKGSLPSFFGGLQKLDRMVPGLVVGFGIYTVDSELKDQDDLYKNIKIGSSTINRYHRTANSRSATYYAGGAAAMRFGSNFSVGVGLNYFNVDELVQIYQDADISGIDADGNSLSILQTVAVRDHLTAHGIEPVLGVQFAVRNFSIGAMVRKGFLVSQHWERSLERNSNQLTSDWTTIEGVPNASTNLSRIAAPTTKSDEPLGTWPGQARLGAAWFANAELMVAADVSYHEAVTDADEMGSKTAMYEREAVINYAFGTEYYLTPSIPLRLGVFTNNDARANIDKSFTDQRDHIDYLGESLFLAWVQPNSQIAIGAIFQQGKGEAQKIEGSATTQDIIAESQTFAFSATHNF